MQRDKCSYTISQILGVHKKTEYVVITNVLGDVV